MLDIDKKILDINKNIVVAAPAGSGKTEKLARRYIALLLSGVSPERILAITFTEKAAAEMKERILKILREEKQDLYRIIKEKIFLMRIYTIHSFCLTLLKRFAFEKGLDPNFEIIEPEEMGVIDEIIDSFLVKLIDEKNNKLKDFVLELSTKYGWNKLKDFIKRLFDLRPSSLKGNLYRLDTSNFLSLKEEAISSVKQINDLYEVFKESFQGRDFDKIFTCLNSLTEYFLTQDGKPRSIIPRELKIACDKATFKNFTDKMNKFFNGVKKIIYNLEIEKLYEIFKFCNEEYTLKKKELNLLDFNDLELLTYELLNESSEVDNILFAFDEYTDHILVDEFQDTNFLQWTIIKKLTEEWRAGLGSKREEGTNPTLFIVGDKKQSIYGFRNANVEVFDTAIREMQGWYGKMFAQIGVKENYRCGREIVNYVNDIFSKIMTREENDPYWKTGYERFNSRRKPEGKVILLIIEEKEASKKEEAERVAKTIKEIIKNEKKYVKHNDEEIEEKIKYKDIALLLRTRTHLNEYETALRKEGIPIVVVRGLGFHQEPEITILRALIFFLIESSDDYSLYLLLKSPLLNISEDEILEMAQKQGLTLYEKIKDDENLRILNETLKKVNKSPLNHLIEEFLIKTKGWEVFYELQRTANIKKFIQIVQEFESQGKSLQSIKAYFEEKMNALEEPKANLNTEEMDAVKIMTIHTAKGLEFPVVFVVGMEKKIEENKDEIRVKVNEDNINILYCPDYNIRREEEDFRELINKEEEEEKRIFYVALTRARDILVLSGVKSSESKGFWKYVVDDR
ncbi:MAG: UvrD-helicase domain-containing protein [Candidatus Firestonebacteria bacterium]